MKILGSEKPSKGFQTLLDVGFLEHFLPEMIPMVGCSQNKYHEYDVWKHTLYTMDYVKNTPILKLAALFHDIAKVSTKGIHPKTGEGTFYNHEDVGYTMTQNIMERLKFSNEEIKLVSELVLNHFIHLEANASKSAIRRWVRKVGINSLDDIFELAIADINAKGNAKTPLDVEWIHSLKNKIQGLVIEEGEPISSNTLAINGHDVMEALNLKPGKQVGDVLKNLLELVTDNPELNIREILLEKIKSITL
jgi:tRNA nucleotidyltransferase (CCA-adding enzyme)